MYYDQTIVPWTANYDEDKVPPYALPDPLICLDGTKIRTVEEWNTKRRPELLALFREYFYGDDPAMPDFVKYETLEESPVFDGLGIRRQIRMTFSMKNGRSRSVVMLLFIPTAKRPCPVFVGLTFNGNHAVSDDPAIIPTGATDPDIIAKERGAHVRRFPIADMLKRGYAYAICSLHDFFLDSPKGWSSSIYTLFHSEEELKIRLEKYSCIGAWSWGLSRMLDYLETVPEIDAAKAISIGHSRLGKTSLWTGARDPRFKLVCVNCSGCGGAAPDRRLFGETLYAMMGNCCDFSYWFCGKMKEFALTPDRLPVDQHELISLVAPRCVAVHSGTKDRWADPHGEFISTYHAGEVYRLFGLKAIESETPPPPDTPVGADVCYFARTGEHDMLAEDYSHYMDCADRIFR